MSMYDDLGWSYYSLSLHCRNIKNGIIWLQLVPSHPKWQAAHQSSSSTIWTMNDRTLHYLCVNTDSTSHNPCPCFWGPVSHTISLTREVFISRSRLVLKQMALAATWSNEWNWTPILQMVSTCSQHIQTSKMPSSDYSSFPVISQTPHHPSSSSPSTRIMNNRILWHRSQSNASVWCPRLTSFPLPDEDFISRSL